MNTFFQNYSTIIVFLHVISAVIWIGGMIVVRFAVHPSLQSIENPKIKLGKTLEIVGRLFNLVMPFILILLLSAVVLELGLGLKNTTVHIKEAIWTIMTLNFTYMYYKRKKAQKLFDNGNMAAAKEQVRLLPNLLLPINVILGMVAIVLGVTLRGF